MNKQQYDIRFVMESWAGSGDPDPCNLDFRGSDVCPFDRFTGGRFTRGAGLSGNYMTTDDFNYVIGMWRNG